MKTIFLSFFPAYPPTSGAAAVTYNCARYMPGERWLVQLGPEPGERMLEDGLRLVTLPWASGRLTKLMRLRRRIAEMTRLCQRVAPDRIVLEGASWAMYHLLLLRALRRKRLKSEIIYHAHNVEHTLRKQKHGRSVTALTGWAEGRLLRESDRAFACSTVDQQEFERLYGVRPELLPNGVDVERFTEVDEAKVATVRGKYGLKGELVLFMGMYTYQPNREGIDFLVHEVLPQVLKQRPDARLAILGGSVPYERPWLIQPGSIPHEDLPAFVKACDVGVAPIFSGSGTRLKILEYLAGALPVVATAKGAEGLPLRHGESILLAEQAEAFADATAQLLDNHKQAASLVAEGRRIVDAEFSWPGLMRRFGEVLPTEPTDTENPTGMSDHTDNARPRTISSHHI